jgi:hypothetical protein
MTGPAEVFPAWRPAQREVDRHAREAPLSPGVLRTTGLMKPDLAERVAEWFTATPAVTTEAVRQSYRALERDAARLFGIARGLGVRVRHVDSEPYANGAELCAELRERRSMALVAGDEEHPLIDDMDQLRVVHDVFGHAALGVGFDLQSEFATWLQCRTLFSREARPAAFCELVGAVTAYVMTGVKPGLRAKLPPAELLASLTIGAGARTRARGPRSRRGLTALA